jgi:hypothetical protein
LLEEAHLCLTEIENLVFFTFFHGLFVGLVMLDFAAIFFFFLNRFSLAEFMLWSDILRNEECVSLRLALLALAVSKAHLLMIWRGEHVFCLCILGQFSGEDFALDIDVGLNI